MSKHQRIAWLVSLLVLLLMMISVGGITRLTKSGLSITEWRPVTGILPPLTEEAWQKEFTLYQNSPEFQQHNAHFELEDYKGIFWWEYIHRVLGRVIFFVAAAMGFLFWKKGVATGRYALFLPALITFQGLIGWLMVRTGLNHRPSVSHFMLTVHFLLALITMTTVYYPLAKMKKSIPVQLSRQGYSMIVLMGVLIVLQIIYGCFTSGLRAGQVFNTFPLMGDSFWPPDGLHFKPAFRNLFENPITVQWIHRWLGIITGTFVLVTSAYLVKRESPLFKRLTLHLVSVVLIQIVLGISTLLLHAPIHLAVFHQMMAVLIWLGYCNIIFRVERPRLSMDH